MTTFLLIVALLGTFATGALTTVIALIGFLIYSEVQEDDE